MKKFHIAVRVNMTLINKTGINTVLMISAQETPIGFIHVEESMSGTPEAKVTPFTSDGLLPEADCTICAIRNLFALRFKLPAADIETAELFTGKSEMIEAVLTNHRTTRHSTH